MDHFCKSEDGSDQRVGYKDKIIERQAMKGCEESKDKSDQYIDRDFASLSQWHEADISPHHGISLLPNERRMQDIASAKSDFLST